MTAAVSNSRSIDPLWASPVTRPKVKVRSVGTATTPHGSQVKLGVVESEGPENGMVYLRFIPSKGKNCRKRTTSMGISREAMEGLHSLWNARLEYESKKKEWTYRAMVLVRRLIPYAWAGIPPVQNPGDFRRIEGTWSVRQPETQTPQLK